MIQNTGNQTAQIPKTPADKPPQPHKTRLTQTQQDSIKFIQYRQIFQKHGIKCMETCVSHYFECELKSSSILQEFQEWVVKIGYVEVELKIFVGEFGRFQVEFQRNLYQINGWDYQMFPTQPTMAKQDIRKAAYYKLLRILLESQFFQNQSNIHKPKSKQDHSVRFDLIWDKKSTILLIPSLNIPISSINCMQVLQKSGQDLQNSKYQFMYKQIETKLLKVINFLTISQVISMLTFMVVEQHSKIEQQAHEQQATDQNRSTQSTQNFSYRLYVTWGQYHNCYFFNYQSQVLENLFNPYTNLMFIQVSSMENKCLHAQFPVIQASKFKVFGVERALELLADFYVNKNYEAVFQLYEDFWNVGFVKNNKNLLINLLTTLYYEVDSKNYANYRTFLCKQSGLFPEPIKIKPTQRRSPRTSPKKNSRGQILSRKSSYKKQISENRDMRSNQKISEFSMDAVIEGVNYNVDSSINQVRVHNEDEKEEFSDLGNNILGPIGQKNKSQTEYILGEEYEYLLKCQQKKQKKYLSADEKIQKKYSYASQEQPEDKKQFNYIFKKIHGNYINYSLYFVLKKHKGYLLLGSKSEIENYTLKQIGAYFLVQPIENLIVFSLYYLILVGELDVSQLDKVDVKFCTILLGKIANNYFVEIGNFIKDSKIQYEEEENRNRQECAQDPYRTNYLEQAYYLLNQLILLSLRFNIMNITDLFQFEAKISEKRQALYQCSEKSIKKCKEFLNNPDIKLSESDQTLAEQNSLSLYTAWLISCNLQLIFLQNYSYQLQEKMSISYFKKTLEVYKQNSQYLDSAFLKNAKTTQNSLLKISIRMLEFFNTDIKIYLCRKFNLTTNHTRQMQQQLLLSIGRSFATIKVTSPKKVYNVITQSVLSGVRKVEQNLLILTCLNNYFLDKVCQESNFSGLMKAKKFFFSWLDMVSVSKTTIKWICKSYQLLSSLFDPTKPRIHSLLTLYSQLFNIPTYLQNFCLVDYQNPQKLFQIMQKIQGFLDSVKKHIKENHHKKQYLNLNVVSDQYIFGYTIGLVSNFRLMEYKIELQEIITGIYENLIEQNPILQSGAFIFYVLRYIKRFGYESASKIVQLILKQSYVMLGELDKHIENMNKTNSQGYRSFQQKFQQLEQKVVLGQDSSYLKLGLWASTDANTLAYLKLKEISAYFTTTNSYLYYLPIFNTNIEVYLNVLYNKLKVIELEWSEVQCMSIKIICQTLKFKLIENPVNVKKSVQDQSKIIKTLYAKEKNKINSNLTLMAIVLNKLIKENSTDWTEVYEECYNCSFQSRNSFEFTLNSYILKFKDSYIDRLLGDQGRSLKNSPSLYLIGIQFLRSRRVDDIQIEKQFQLFRLLCLVFYKNKGALNTYRVKYISSVLEFISAKLYSVSSLKKSKKHYNKLAKFYKNTSPSLLRVMPVLNSYHKIHRLYEKFERQQNYRSNGRKIYKSLCSQCGFIQNRDIRPKRVLIGLINRVKKMEQFLGLQQKA